MVRVRFAPSPTGFLHIGGARTALFNWIYAKSQAGAFILRIEDTDAARSKKEYVDEILNSLQWLGFNWDEIYYQSERYDIYKEYAQKLLKDGKAYLAQKLPAQPEGQVQPQAAGPAGGQAIILKIHQQKIVLNDIIRGNIEFDTEVIKDQVLIKSDGTPTYNFACVIDDALMRITHVIRGDDHISNTPKQIIMYEALGLPVPAFAHLPLILATEGGRLSKRKGATAISEFRAMGYLPQALVNFLLLLGWSPGDNREVIEPAGAIKLFDIRHINKTAAVLDLDKLNWINNQYLKSEAPDKLAAELMPLLIEKGLIDKDKADMDYLRSIVGLLQARLTTLNDFPERADFFFLKDPVMDPKAEEKFLSRDMSEEFSAFIQRLMSLAQFEIPQIEEAFRQLTAELKIEAKALIHPIRVALTGKTVGPGLFDVIYYLGKERAIERLKRYVKTGG
ncbi:MAG: glutamate--tRNA ligase [Candidatus Omnitrophica bacterium]|nr:glutamate--tRNA ligase [Candidatus Omnitrophota bacterium]